MEQQEYAQRGYLREDFRLFHLKGAMEEQLDWHYHTFHKLIFFLGGQSGYGVEGRSYPLEPGDVILGLPSTGVHSNGYSLVRRIISDNGLSLDKVYEGLDKPLGEVLLTPTRLYPKPILPVIHGTTVKGLVHITGGGFYDNIPRVLPKGTRAVLDAEKWPLLPIFPFLMKQGGVDPHEMYRTYNCGLGMLLILSRENAEKAKEILASMDEPVYEVGEITEGNQDVVVTGGLFNE